MSNRPAHGVPPLPRGSVLRLENAQETLVCPRHGCVWLTQERDQRDIVLGPGQQFRITRSGRTLIEALRDSEIDLVSPHGERLAQRIDLVHRGASALPLYESRSGLRGRIAALGTRLMKAWLEFHAARPPRRLGRIV